MASWLQSLTPKRVVTVALAPGFLALGIDAAISHHMLGEPSAPLQYVPVVYSAAAMLVLLAVAVPRLSEALFAWSLRIVGGLGVLTGLGGTWLHLAVVLDTFKRNEDERTRELFDQILSTAPPVFAPAAFAGVGALLIVLASPRLHMRVKL
ncbi:MAG: hypothetical protein ACK4N5_12635, partial [Myxococcales bacterium]